MHTIPRDTYKDIINIETEKKHIAAEVYKEHRNNSALFIADY